MCWPVDALHHLYGLLKCLPGLFVLRLLWRISHNVKHCCVVEKKVLTATQPFTTLHILLFASSNQLALAAISNVIFSCWYGHVSATFLTTCNFSCPLWWLTCCLMKRVKVFVLLSVRHLHLCKLSMSKPLIFEPILKITVFFQKLR